MRMRRVMILAMVVAALVVAGCGGRQSAAVPRFASVTVTDEERGTVDKSTFAPDVPRIYVRFTLADAPAGTIVKSVWIAEKTEADPETKLDEGTLTVSGSATSGRFWFSRPPLGWAVRPYRVELYLGDRLAHTARFQVQAAAAPPPSAGPRVGPIIFARGTTQDSQPVDRSSQFEVGVKIVYAFFNYEGLRPDDTVTQTWYRGDEKVLDNTRRASEFSPTGTVPEKGNLVVSIQWEDQGAAAGAYRLEIRINGTLVQSAGFTVGVASAPPSGSPIGAITFAHGESGGDPDRPADRFAAGVKRVYAFFSFAGLKADDVIRGVWTAGGRQVLEKQLTLKDVFSGRPPEKGTLWLWIQWDSGAPAGTYRLDISVNGAVVRSGTFVVEP